MKGQYLTFNEFGRPGEVLEVESKEIQQPEVDEVLVRMIARPMNPSDLIPIRGLIDIESHFQIYQGMRE